MMLIISGRYGTVVSYLRLMFWTPRPTLETSSDRSFRSPPSVDGPAELAVRPFVFDGCCEAATDAAPTNKPAPVIAVLDKKSRRVVLLLGCWPFDSVFSRRSHIAPPCALVRR